MEKELIDYMAKNCHYAQDHISDWAKLDELELEARLQCTSYTVACFLAQNTKHGSDGVEWDIVLDELKKFPKPSSSAEKEIKRWTKIIKEKVKIFS